MYLQSNQNNQFINLETFQIPQGFRDCDSSVQVKNIIDFYLCNDEISPIVDMKAMKLKYNAPSIPKAKMFHKLQRVQTSPSKIQITEQCNLNDVDGDAQSEPRIKIAMPQINMNKLIEYKKQHMGPDISTKRERFIELELQSNIMNRITTFLYLSDVQAATNKQLLGENKITHIINLSGDIQPIQQFKHINYQIFKVKDSAVEFLSDLFFYCFAFIQKCRQMDGVCLVHCHQGVSRSASLVIAYLMYCNNISFIDAYAHVRSCRPVISPNVGFIFQLVNFWRVYHQTKVQQQLLSNYILNKLIIEGLVPLMEAQKKDKAINDLQESQFTKCRMQQYNELIPLVYQYSFVSVNQQFKIFRLDQNFNDTHAKYASSQTKQQTEKKIEFKFDSKGLYIVTSLAIGTVIVIGKEFNIEETTSEQIQFDADIGAIAQHNIEQLKDEKQKPLQKLRRISSNNSKILFETVESDIFKQLIETLLGDFSNYVKDRINDFLNILFYLQDINKNLIIYRQDEIESGQYDNDIEFSYFMTKMLFYEGQINFQNEMQMELDRIKRVETKQQLSLKNEEIHFKCQNDQIFK